jgi:alpha-glucosidase
MITRNIRTGQKLRVPEDRGVDSERGENWWQHAVIYEIALVSFQEYRWQWQGSLLRRVDYLRWLGVDAVWLNPMQKSPMRDFGYDIADYLSVVR